MSLFIASLNSGSNGNCYYIGNQEEAILVDAGLRCRELEKRMVGLGLDPLKVKAVFVTHEHTDHISGLPALLKRYNIPIYISAATYRSTRFDLQAYQVQSLSAFEPVQIGALSITAFPKWHDAADPHSVIISCAGITTGVFTDIGEPCENVVRYFKQCHAVFLETNYDEEMLANGRYPIFLRNRISGRNGHLSNKQALRLFIDHRPPFMTHVLLSHLSKQNNCPDLVTALFNRHAQGVEIVHAPRDRATAVYHITGAAIRSALPSIRLLSKTKSNQLQLSLF